MQDLNTRHSTELTVRQYAAIQLRVPDSGNGWLNMLIRRANRDTFAKAILVSLATPCQTGIAVLTLMPVCYELADQTLDMEEDTKE